MSDEKPFDSLSIAGFRPFKTLSVPSLSRVNLIVGKNSLGKTSLLEAIQLLSADGSPGKIYDLLLSRDEISVERVVDRRIDAELDAAPKDNFVYESLFYGRPDISTMPEFHIASEGKHRAELIVTGRKLAEQPINDENGVAYRKLAVVDYNYEGQTYFGLQIRAGSKERLLPLEFIDRVRRIRRSEIDIPFLQYVPSSGLTSAITARLWDKIALTEDENVVYEALRLVSFDIERLVFVGDSRERFSRYAMVKLANSPKPMSLLSLGDGTNHLFGIAASLVAARNGILLVDEIENGLHYSIMSQMWELIIQQSKILNVQVFATTHSSDCIRGLGRASTGLAASDAMLIRLEGIEGNFRSVCFNPSEIKIAIEEEIELR